MTIAFFFSIFLTIFIAELGDKTQIATLAISGTSQRPFAVFLGSSFALVLASLIGVLLGGSIAQIIPDFLIELVAAIGFMLIGLSLLVSNREIENIGSTK